MSDVVTAQPKIGGCVYFAPVSDSLTIPTDATTALPEQYKSVGYISEDGVENDDSVETEEIKDWKGDVVCVVTTGHSDKFKFTMISALNPNALKMRYGTQAVTGTPDTGMTVKSNSEYIGEKLSVVIEKVLQGGYVQREVISCCSLSEVDTINYKSNEAMGYGVTMGCLADANGNTHISYTSKKPSA